MAQTLEAQIILSALDKTGAVFGAAARHAKAMAGQVEAAGRQMRNFGAGMSLAVTTPIVAIGRSFLGAAGDFEATMNRVEYATKASGAELEALRGQAKALGANTIFSASEAAEAIEELANAGVGTADILGGALAGSMNLAAAGGGQLADAASLTTSIMANFKKGAGDLDAVVDGVAGTLAESKMKLDDYRLAFAAAGGVAGGYGLTLEDFNAVLAATSSAFASGSDAGTSFKTFLDRIGSKPTKEALEVMKKYGLRFIDNTGKLKGMAEVAEELREGLSGLSDAERITALSTIFGADAQRTAIRLMEEGREGVEAYDRAIGEADADAAAAARMKGYKGSLEELSGAFQNLGIAVGEAGLIQWATDAARGMTDLVNNLAETNPEMLKLGTAALGIAAVVGPSLMAFGQIATGVAMLGKAFRLAGLDVLAMRLIMRLPLPLAIGAAAALGIWAGWEPLTKWLQSNPDATDIAAEGQAALGLPPIPEHPGLLPGGGVPELGPLEIEALTALGLEPQPVEIGGEIKVTVTVDGPGHVSGVTVPVRPENVRLNVGVDNTGVGNTGVGAR